MEFEIVPEKDGLGGWRVRHWLGHPTGTYCVQAFGVGVTMSVVLASMRNG